MKVLFSTPPFHPAQSYALRFPRFPPLNLALLAATVRDRHAARIVSPALAPCDPDVIVRAAREFAADVVAFSIPSAVSAFALGAAVRRLRAAVPNVRIVAGGPFATFEAAFCLGLGLDAVFLGEADETFPRWIDGDAPGGVATRSEDDSVALGEKVIVEDLDALPIPAWDLFPVAPAIYTGRRAAAVEMSRGCPYGCTFCTVHEFGQRYRARSVGRTMAELSFLAGSGVRELLFVDNSFALREDDAAALAESILSAHLPLEFGVYLRADTAAANPGLLALLARAGLRYAIVGFESYAQASLDAVKKQVDEATNRAAALALRSAGVFVVGSHIYGSPGERPADLRRTYRLGVRYSDLYKAGIYTPLPGSALHDTLRRDGLLAGADPLAADHVRYLVGGRGHRRRIQFWSMLLFAAYLLHPARWRKTLSRDPWTRAIFRIEYRALIARLAFVLRSPGLSRATGSPILKGIRCR